MSMPTFDTSPLAKDYTATGTKIEGPWENDRNRCYRQLFKDMIKEAMGVDEVFVGHHIIYELPDPNQGAVPQEIPSADCLYLDHTVMHRLFGEAYLDIISRVAREPVETRDQLMADLYYSPYRTPAR